MSNTQAQRKVILFMHLSLDGYVGKPGESPMAWSHQDADMEIGRAMIPALLKTGDTMLLGRDLYQGFEQAWPAMAKAPGMPPEIVALARWIEDTQKVVFSTTLEQVSWRSSTLVRVQGDADIAAEVRRLKAQPGGDIVVFGGARLAQTLVRLDLVDEYQFKLESVVLGAGYRLFERVQDLRKLELVRSQPFKSGVLGLYYRRRAQ